MQSITFAADRRLSFRHALHVPLQVRIWKTDIPKRHAVSENISTSGIFFMTDLPVAVGTVVEVMMQMPQQLTGEPPSLWRCSGHVVRILPAANAPRKSRVGVQFDCYEVAREESVVALRASASPKAFWPRD